jgi:HSP20 family molecular chaperone IbpA
LTRDLAVTFAAGIRPRTLYEADDAIVLEAGLPGVKPEDVKVDIMGSKKQRRYQ